MVVCLVVVVLFVFVSLCLSVGVTCDLVGFVLWLFCVWCFACFAVLFNLGFGSCWFCLGCRLLFSLLAFRLFDYLIVGLVCVILCVLCLGVFVRLILLQIICFSR